MDEMTVLERIDAAIALQPVDRVPVVPIMGVFSAPFVGIPLGKTLHDAELARDAEIEAFDKLGGWDATYFPGRLLDEMGWAMFAMDSKLPTYELPEDALWQLDEKEIMQIEDYDFILQNGWNAYLVHALPRLKLHVPAEEFIPRLQAAAAQQVKDIQIWEQKGVPVFAGLGPLPPLEAIGFTRSMKALVLDIYRRPEKVIAAMEAILPEQLGMSIAGFKAVKDATRWGNRVSFVGGTRATFLAPKFFDKFAWPYIQRTVSALLEAGITPMLHFDSDWTPFLEYFLKLPPRQVILELDGMTDIFKAKEILKGHMCIMGDVPANLLTLGTPEQVTAYVKKLIDVVGEDNGYILSTGCDCPINANPENVQAMIDTGKSYYPHHTMFASAGVSH